MNVLIVESAAKTRTIKKYLGNDWRVLATGGHVETLPQDRNAHGKSASKAYWSNRPGELPAPPWVWTDRGETAVGEILDAGGEKPIFWIATDPDREGEFIILSKFYPCKIPGIMAGIYPCKIPGIMTGIH